MPKKIKIVSYVGQNIDELIDDIAHLRISLFREFPYLYEGSLAYEKEYLKNYMQNPHALLILLKDKNKIVGAGTGIPFGEAHFFQDAIETFQNQGLHPNECYYIGEVLILPEYRGHYFTKKVIAEYETLIRSWGFKYITFMTVIRDKQDPRQPLGYKDPAPLWKRHGFQKTKIFFNPAYPTIQANGTIKTETNAMVFWIKKL